MTTIGIIYTVLFVAAVFCLVMATRSASRLQSDVNKLQKEVDAPWYP